MKTLSKIETAAFQVKLGVKPDSDWGDITQAAFEKFVGISPVAAIPSNNAMTPRSAKIIATLLPQVQPEFLRLLNVAGAVANTFDATVEAISGTRTYAEQTALYAKGRTAPGPKVTNANAGYSNHNFGVAVDLGIFRGGKYLDSEAPREAERIHGKIAEAVKNAGLNLEWGGDWTSFKDVPHWEYATGLSTAQKRDRVAKGQSILS